MTARPGSARRRWLLLLFVLAGCPWRFGIEGVAAPAAESARDKVGFRVRFNEETSSYRVLAVFVLPGERLGLQATGPQDATYRLEATAGTVDARTESAWHWTAPQTTGLHPIRIVHVPSEDVMTLNAFVMVPYDSLKGEDLNGYRIGTYPTVLLKNLAIYRPPRGFVEVTPQNVDTPVSPHFRLGQFVCKQEGGYPKYLVLRERLLLKLELILEQANQKGYAAETFHVMSGYRTPYYNKAIGNVKYSRHVWGGAADIFIDENPRDGRMDDLNADGSVDYRDAGVLYEIVDKMVGSPFYGSFVGGLGRYRTTSSHGPFVHVDVRGFRARWGD